MSGRIFVIGASHGGIDALQQLVRQLPASFPAPVFIVQHIGAASPSMLPVILGKAARLPVTQPHNLEIFEKGRIYVAPPDHHMLVRQGYLRLSQGPRENHCRPAIDPLFRSASNAYGPAVVGVVLTGHLDDGTDGLMAIKDRGGIAVVQEPSEALAPSMPRSGLAHVCIDHCCKLGEMGELFVSLANDDPDTPVSGDYDELIRIETRIAEGILDTADWALFERMSAPSGLNCPECTSALFELRDRRMMRFRCRAGHAFSALCLLGEQQRSRDNHLAALFGLLNEEAALARRLLNARLAQRIDTDVALHERIGGAEREATQVWQWLCASERGASPPDGQPGSASAR
ncbi:two-component system chemotaxis response regulator CheB [Paraburkholderia atlantica]|uniref:protein-glutamate methylesterase n=1 Tax=Paraburkholderia atlantica TaxID=2654982 RepID=A0A6I1PU14_PARAM|nr:chemotaxis protein CheB [Paraburkholderia atlantica]MBB5428950.1 two-component system chemotaxis response regulator CheB [Paraburkholderia atlantica]MPW08426.1 chemotaxis protein CheB [Paraburkholderia atlantica]NUY35666.1 chemotaxis protein CheB [Paraburkholderia atlantica]